MIEVPCATMSTAAWPAVRSHSQSREFNRSHPKTFLGNLLAFRGFILLGLCWRLGVPCALENPRRSKLFWMPWVRSFLRKPGALYSWLASCAFGCKHKKEFAFVSCHVPLQQAHRRCPGGHTHVPVQGKLAKESAMYHPAVASAWPTAFIQLCWTDRYLMNLCPPVSKACLRTTCSVAQTGIPSLTGGGVRLATSESCNALLKHLVLQGGDQRLPLIVDSAVAMGAHRKGRSSARFLRALACVGGLYPSTSFGPTRLSVSDDPTRDKVLRSPCPHRLYDFLDDKGLGALAALHSLPRFSSKWLRLSAVSLLRQGGSPSAFLQAVLDFPKGSRFSGLPASSDHTGGLLEGPTILCSLVSIWLFFPLASAALAPRNRADLSRLAGRAPFLAPGRPVQPLTS